MAEQKYTISDIIETYISGDWGNDEPTEDASCPVSCIRGADIVPIYNSEYRNIPLRYISEKSLSNRALREGDIVIEKSGGSPTQSTGRVVYISKELLEEKQDIVCSNFCAAFRIKPEWDAKYVYYYLQHIYNAGVFFNFEGKTSGLKNLIMDTAFKSITIKKIAIETQRSIATALSTIESKMAANRAINHYLEAMAKQLYDYWFVQFDFPDENGKPYKSSGGKMVWNDKLKREIPEGWNYSLLSEYLCVYSEKISTKDVSKDDNYAPIEVLPRRKMSFSECAPIENALSGLCRFKHKHILLSNRRVYFHKICIAPFDGLTRDTVIILYPTKTNLLGYSYQLVNDDVFIEYATKHSYGSEQPVLSWEEAKQYKVVKPPQLLECAYSRLIEPIIDQVIRNELEISAMVKQRDELLPLLITGQVSATQLNNDLANG